MKKLHCETEFVKKASRRMLWSAMAVLFVLRTLSAQDLSKIGKEKPVKFTGSLGARTIFYDNSGFPARRQGFTYLLTGNAALQIYDLNIPFSFTYSNQDFSFNQPFNQFGASPTYKWLTLHLGHRNLNYSQYTLAGHQMLGAGIEINPGKFRTSFMYGRLQKAVSEDTTLLSLRRPTYERKGWGFKIGYGKGVNFIDLILFKAEDDENSLQSEPVQSNVTPGENLVMGLNFKKKLFKKMSIYFDGAVSTYVLDKTLEGEPLVKIPGILKIFENLVNFNQSTYFYTAMKTGLNFNTKGFGLSSYFQRIDPDYRSMGLYFVNNDVMAFNVAPSFVMIKGKLRLSGALTWQRDNLTKKKAVTTKRFIPQVTIGVSPGTRWNLGFTYTNMSMLMEEGAIPLDNSLKMDQNNPIYTGNISYTVADTIRAHTVTLFGNRSELIDNNSLTQEFSQYVGSTINITYSYNNLRKFWGLYGSFNSNNLKTFSGTLPGTGFSLGGNKGLAENKLNLSASLSIASQENTDSQSFVFGANYQLKKHQFGANLNFLSTQVTNGKYREFTGYLNYSIRI